MAKRTQLAVLLVIVVISTGGGRAALAATYEPENVMGPIGSPSSFRFGNSDLNQRMAELRARQFGVQRVEPGRDSNRPVTCAPVDSTMHAPAAMAPSRAPTPAEYSIPSTLSPALQARMLELRSRNGRFGPAPSVAVPVGSGPPCPEEPELVQALAPMSFASLNAPRDPMAGSLPSLQSTSIEPMSVPEPGTLGLLGIGLAGLGLSRRRRKA